MLNTFVQESLNQHTEDQHDHTQKFKRHQRLHMTSEWLNTHPKPSSGYLASYRQMHEETWNGMKWHEWTRNASTGNMLEDPGWQHASKRPTKLFCTHQKPTVLKCVHMYIKTLKNTQHTLTKVTSPTEQTHNAKIRNYQKWWKQCRNQLKQTMYNTMDRPKTSKDDTTTHRNTPKLNTDIIKVTSL